MLTMEDLEDEEDFDSEIEDEDGTPDFNGVDLTAFLPLHQMVPFIHDINNSRILSVTKLSNGLCTIINTGCYAFYLFSK